MNKTRKTILKIKVIMALPSIWLSCVILILSILSICISKIFFDKDMVFESSLFSNIFAGLITGLIISILSGTKAVYVAYMHGRLLWLKQTHRMVLKHVKKGHELYEEKNMSDEEFFNTAYDAASYVNHVNLRIMHSTFDKVKWFDPPKYCLKHYNYNCLEKESIFEELHDFISCNGLIAEKRKEVIAKIHDVTRIITALDDCIQKDILSIEVKIASAQKSFL